MRTLIFRGWPQFGPVRGQKVLRQLLFAGLILQIAAVGLGGISDEGKECFFLLGVVDFELELEVELV
jgi:hypothetical protein